MKLFNKKKKTKFLMIFLLIFLIGFFVFFIKKSEIPISSVSSPTDLFNHPIYSKYEFNKSDSIINIGIQPLYLPTGIIFEVIKRDIILNKALSALGKKIEYYTFLKGADINYFLKKNKLHGGVGGDMPALSISSGFDVVIPVIIQKGKASIVSSGPVLTNDLKGKRIAYPFGSISHYFILELLQSSKIREDMVRLIPMDVSVMGRALNNNEIDLFCAWEPNVASILKQNSNFFITYQQMTTGYLYFAKAFVQKNSKSVNHILAAVIRSISWMKSDRKNLLFACEWNIKAMEKLTGKKSILNVDEIADLVLSDILRYYSKYSIVITAEDIKINSSLHKEYKFLKSRSVPKKKGSWEQVSKSFDNKLITGILKQPKKYHLNDYNYILIEKGKY